MDLKLAGSTVLITGASKGIGEATARAFAAEGSRLVLVARSVEGLERVRDSIRAVHAVEIDLHACDLSIGERVVELAGRFREVDVLVNNAGAVPGGGLLEVSEAAWRAGWDTKVFAYVNMRSWKRRLLFVGFAILMSLVANWARAYMIVLIGHYSEMRYGTGADHLYFGWVFFGLVMFLVFWAGNRWADDQMQTSVAAPVGPARPIPLSTDAAVRLAALGALALAVTAVLSESGRAADAVPRTDAAQVAERTLRERYFGPVSVGARFDGARYIEQGRLARLEDIEYLVGYFASQVPGAELVTVTNEPVDDVSGRWRVEGPLRVDGGEGVAANETAVRADGVSWLVWHWYTVAGVHYASESRVKLATLAALISTGSDDATVSLVAIRVDQRGVEQARQRLRMAVGEVRRFGEAVTVR